MSVAEQWIRIDSWSRRVTDVAVAATALVFAAPLLLGIALAIRRSGRGPVFYSQQRVGRGGVRFRILKFRTMTAEAGAAGRVTPVGAVLRATKLNELPQLWNVVRGEMTLVGPRPEVPAMIVHYTDSERRVLDVRPGITGPGQLDYTTTGRAAQLDGVVEAETFYVAHHLHPKLADDLDYLTRRGPWVDTVTLVRTARFVATSLTRELVPFAVAARRRRAEKPG